MSMKVYPFSVVKRTQEFYSFIVRLSLGLCIALYVWLGITNGNFEVSWNIYYSFASVYFISTIILGIDLFRIPESTIRRFITLFFDFSCTSYAILLTGGGDSEFMLIYIWLYIAYGTRYGLPYLLSAVLLVILEYNVLLIIDQSWLNHPLRSSAQIFVLIIMPIYLYSMVKQLHIAKKEAEHATRAKSSFLAIMSHEIRTPMSGLVGTAYLLQKTSQSDEQKQYTNTLVNAAKSLHTLIDDILDFSKIEAKKLILKNEAFDLQQTINEVFDVLKPDAEKKSLGFTHLIEAEVADFYSGDKLRIRQVLINLLGNAIKFTRHGAVSLRISLDQTQHATLHFDIIDTGIGISDKQQKNLFDSFTQAEHYQYNCTHSGTGLGTTISKQLVELMGGKIGVKSHPDKGSHFWFTVSLNSAQEQDIETTQTNDKTINVSLNILIAEDEDINAMVLQNFLHKMGHKTQRVINGSDVLKELSENHYDMIFMDMNMPEINGPETTRLLREEKKGQSHIPVIALTAYATTENREICLDSGMDDFITKPISPEKLSSTIEKFCHFQE